MKDRVDSILDSLTAPMGELTCEVVSNAYQRNRGKMMTAIGSMMECLELASDAAEEMDWKESRELEQ